MGRRFLLFVLSLALVWPAPGRAAVEVVASSDWPPAPVLPPGAAVGVPESAVDGWPSGDPRRAELLLDLALRQHHEAEAVGRDELEARAEALARWRRGEGAPGSAAAGPIPPWATPRADERRAQAVRLAERALEEGGGAFARAPEALLLAGLDSLLVGRSRDGLRHLGTLVRRHPRDPLAQDGWLALGERLLQERELTRACAALEVAASGPRLDVRAFAAARLADAAMEAGDYAGAVVSLSRALEAGAYHAARSLDALADSAWRLEAAPEELERLADLAERAGEPGRAAALRERLAKAAPRTLAAARARSSLAEWRQATAPRGAPARAPRLALRTSAPGGSVQRAMIPDLRVRAVQGDASALGALALLALDAGRAGEARVLLQRALAAGSMPPAAPLENDLGVALHALGDDAAARLAFERAARRDVAFEPARENLRSLLAAGGRR